MAKLESLKTPFTLLAPEERLTLVLAIRLNRRTSKRPPPAERKTSTSSSARTKRAPASVNNLSANDAARLLAELEAMLEMEE